MIKALFFLFLTCALCPAAITRVQSKTGNTAGASGTTLAVTLDSTPTAGNIIVVAACYFGTSSTPGPGAATLSATNVVWMMASPAVQPGSQCNVTLSVGRVFASPGSVVTLTFVSAGGAAMVAVEYSGASVTFDKFASAIGSSAAAASGATATTANANELFVGAIGSRGTNGVTFSAPTNSFSIVGQDKSSLNTSADRSVAFLERIVTSTGTPDAGATISASNIWVSQVLTIEQAAAAGGAHSGTFGN